MQDAYENIRAWYQANTNKLDPDGAYDAASLELISALPEPADATNVEMFAIGWEVIAGLMEWAYVETDGTMKMSEYARQLTHPGGERRQLTEDEMAALKQSALYPLMSQFKRERLSRC